MENLYHKKEKPTPKLSASGWRGAAILVTGPGAIVCGAVGGLIFGTAGYFGADWIADHINEN